MRRLAWPTLGLLSCLSCGGQVVGMQGADGQILNQPPQRGATDGSTNPPPGDASVTDVPRPTDGGAAVDRGAPDLGVVVDAGPDVILGRACAVATGNCPVGSYCFAPGCGLSGNCVVAPVNAQEDPVCGCDRITYWNAAVAAASGASVRGADACPTGLDTVCGGGGGGGAAMGCPAGSTCNLEQPGDAICVANAMGRCWTLPTNCPPLPAGTTPTTRRCVGNLNAACVSRCDLIVAGRIFAVDNTCP
jgi:hypothetical protein